MNTEVRFVVEKVASYKPLHFLHFYYYYYFKLMLQVGLGRTIPESSMFYFS